jgi:hypothetical protein
MSQNDYGKDTFLEAFTVVAREIASRMWDGWGSVPPAIAIPTPNPGDNQLLTRTEAAKFLRVSPTTVTRMRSEKLLHPVKELLPGSVRYRKEDLQAFIDKRR